jgi:hypothetical protein
VIDYVAGRAIEASDLVLQLTNRQNTLPTPVRVLLVERELGGSWGPDYLREAIYSESVAIASSQFALPIRLTNVGDTTLLSLVSEISSRFGVELTEEERVRTVALIRRIDPTGCPLFAMIAAAAQLEGIPPNAKGQIVRSILQREMHRWTLIPDGEARERVLNLLALTTMLGGFSPSGTLGTELWTSAASGLLPNPYFLNDQLFAEVAGGALGESGLPSLQPDFVGEAFVLDRLKGTAGMQRSTRELLGAGWKLDPEAVSQFVRRAVADFGADPAVSIVQEPAIASEVQRESWSRMIADLLPLLGHSDDPQVITNLTSLRDLALDHPGEARLRKNRADAEFNFGNLLFQEGQYAEADEQFSLAISLSPDGSDTGCSGIEGSLVVKNGLEKVVD